MSWTITPSFTQWTPALISTALWLDAADNATVFSDAGTTPAVGGSTVQQWNDKSGNGRHATQAAAGNRPTYTNAALNGKSVVSFDGSMQWFNNFSGFSAGHFAAVAKTAVAKGYAGLHTGLTSELILDASGNQVIQASTSYVNASVNLGITINQPFVWGVSLAAARSAIRTLGQEYNVGGATRAWNGYCCELIALASPQDDVIRAKLEGYLAHKWGLTANLPANHTYKVNPPAP